MAVDYAAWLKDQGAIRIVLVEVGVKSGGLETTRYLSTGDYRTGVADTPANQIYDPIVTTGIQFTEQLDIDGQGTLSAGDIEILNYNGERDSWLDDIWDNHTLKAWLGDPRWERADFQMIFNGVVNTIGSKSRDVLNLSLRDKLQRLNTPITDAVVGGTGTNKDDTICLTFGECANVTPKLTNSGTLEYQIHDGPVEGIFDVRDNGRKVTVTANNTTGRFTLNRQSFGAITASVQGDKNVTLPLDGTSTYKNTISKLIQRIVTGYGKTTDRFASTDLDSSNLAAFETAHPEAVGIYADGRTNVLVLIQQLANSVGAQVVMSRLGLLRLIQLNVPGTGTPIVVDGSQIVERTLVVADRPLVKASIKLGFDRNWTVQQGLLTDIPEAHKSMFATEWRTATATSSTTQTDYKLNASPPQIDTYLCTRTATEAEAARRLDLWKVPRTVFEFEGTSDLLSLELGNAITLFNRRFNLSAGKTGIVISLTPNWLNGRVKVGVLV
jgi:hypothetical protein